MSLTLTRQAKVIIVSDAKNPIDNESLTMCKLVDAAKSSSCGRYWRLVSRDIHFMQVHTCKASGIGHRYHYLGLASSHGHATVRYSFVTHHMPGLRAAHVM